MAKPLLIPKYKIDLWAIARQGFVNFARNVCNMQPTRPISRKEMESAWSDLVHAKWEIWVAKEGADKTEHTTQYFLDSTLAMVSFLSLSCFGASIVSLQGRLRTIATASHISRVNNLLATNMLPFENGNRLQTNSSLET